jgi:type III pantothenate kinase
MADLLIDLGNSRLKWAHSAPSRWAYNVVTHRQRDITGVLDEAWSGFDKPARALFVSVAAEDSSRALESWIEKKWGVRARRLQSPAEQLGVINTYRDPATLGADRWAALLGARGLTQRACVVVSCGTAITVDALSADGVFAGGVIVAGLHLLRQTLSAGTAGIGMQNGDDSSCLAHATADGVAAGALFGLAGAIDRIVQEQERALDTDVEVYMTGGDSELLMSCLTRPAAHVPDLVLKGLARVVETLA